MRKQLLITILFLCMAMIGRSQTPSEIQLPKIFPPSPDAASLGVYGQISADKSTGIPQISIPVYDIKTSRFTLPISLSYMASGIKVDETASWVGLGWSLNAGGVISRTIIGRPDEQGFLDKVLPKADDLVFKRDSAYIQQVAQDMIDYDTQPDNFFYNFSGFSGAFVFGNDKNPLLTPYKPLKITYTRNGPTLISGFEVKDTEGNRYLFNNIEYTSNSSGGNSFGPQAGILLK